MLNAATESMRQKVRAQMLDVNEQYVRDLDRWKLNTGGLGTDASKVQLKPAVNLLRPLLIRSKKLKRRPGTAAPPAPPAPPPPLPPQPSIAAPSSKPVFLPPSRPMFAATSGGFSGGSIPPHLNQQQQQQQSSVMKKRKADDLSSGKSVSQTGGKPMPPNPVVVASSSSSVVKRADEVVVNEISGGGGGASKKRRHRVNENGESVSNAGVNSAGGVVKSEVERGDVMMRRIVDDSENRNESRHVRIFKFGFHIFKKIFMF